VTRAWTSVRRHWRLWLATAIAVVLGVTVVGPFVFIHFIEGPPPASLSLGASTPTATARTAVAAASPSSAAATNLPGTYTIASGSEVEYRVTETLFGQSNTAVGISTTVDGSFTLQGTTVTAATFTVPLDTVHSNESLRDNQFDTRIMDVTEYPDAVFKLTSPVLLGSIPAVDAIVNEQVTGTLTMHGVTRSVTFVLQAEYTGASVKVSGSIPITFADWDIQNPSGGPAQVGNSGTMEFLLTLSR
jgi:polyisoprenoid-binding protein YceI